mmetsp:Transcript_8327/g.14137  ORF Transcript_8327/g.14137 Transcript_8327/m.14137 type:complete len:617 (-) Transcript_8327:148-1998(-)
MMDDMSVVDLYGEHESSCGYCKGEKTSCSYGLVSKKLTCEDYQDMIDFGWRRSGTYLYKPTMSKTCCPQYTIRLQALKFKANKQQRNVLNRARRLCIQQEERQQRKPPKLQPSLRIENETSAQIKAAVCQALERIFLEGLLGPADRISPSSIVRVTPCKDQRHGAQYTCTAPFIIRSLLKKQMVDFEVPSEEHIASTVCNAFCLEGVMISFSKGFLNFTLNGETDDSSKNAKGDEQKVVEGGHNIPVVGKSPNKNESTNQESPPMPRLTLSIVPAAFTEEVFALYKKYQMRVHGDKEEDVTEKSFTRFLVNSPLFNQNGQNPVAPEAREKDGGGGEEGAGEPFTVTDALVRVPFGSYHMLYRHDGALVAVGVVDVLPRCLSSVYAFYDPDYRHLVLGKLTALKEIEWVRRAAAARPGLRFYYLGYYIHDCPKMRYKGEYAPSALLCPETYRWVPLTGAQPLLNERKYCRLHPYAMLEAAEGQQQRPATGNSRGLNDQQPLGKGKRKKKTGEAQEGDQPGFGAGERKEEVSPPSGSSVGLKAHDEGGAAPQEGRRAVMLDAPRPATAEAVPLDVGAGRPVGLGELAAPGRERLRPLLVDWAARVPAPAARRVVVRLC